MTRVAGLCIETTNEMKSGGGQNHESKNLAGPWPPGPPVPPPMTEKLTSYTSRRAIELTLPAVCALHMQLRMLISEI